MNFPSFELKVRGHTCRENVGRHRYIYVCYGAGLSLLAYTVLVIGGQVISTPSHESLGDFAVV